MNLRALRADEFSGVVHVQPQPDKLLDRIVCGDVLDVLGKMPAGSVDLVITSPPYNIRNSTGNGLKNGRGGKWENAALQHGYTHHDDCMPHDEYVAWQRRCLAEMLRVVADDGAIFYNHKWRVQGGLLQDRQDIVAGFPVRQVIIWRRKGGFNFNPGYFLPTYEVIYLITKPGSGWHRRRTLLAMSGNSPRRCATRIPRLSRSR
jgi:site-specific DNA-methyltransferase (adenine-specific)